MHKASPTANQLFPGGESVPTMTKAGVCAEHSGPAEWGKQGPEREEAETLGSQGRALEKRMLQRAGGRGKGHLKS